MRILVVDDHALVRKGICSVLATSSTLTVCGEAVDGQEGVDKARELRPDVVVMDLSMPRLNGLEATKEIKRLLPDTEILIVTQHESPEMARQAFGAGARGYVSKSAISTDLLAAIAKIGRNESIVQGISLSSPSRHLDLQGINSEQASALLAAIVESSDDAIVSKDLDGTITSWNKGAQRIFGYKPEEAIGRNIRLIIPADHQDEETTILARVKRGERIEHFETVRVRSDGTYVDISLTVSPVRDSAGRVIGASKVARDISEQKHMGRALGESEERFRAIVDTTPECVKLVSAEGILLYMNASGLTMVGADSAEMILGKNVYDLVAETDRERFRAFNEKVCHGERGELEFEIVGLRGAVLRMESHSAPLQMPDGRTVQLAVTRDITERARVEEELRRSEKELRSVASGLESQVHIRTRELELRNAEILEQSEQLRELSNRLLQTQDYERRHIARELHDSAGQTLTVLSMNVAKLVQNAKKDAPQLAKGAEEVLQLVQQLSQEIRTTSYLLHPPLLDESGLGAAVSWYIKGLQQRSGIEITLNISEEFGRLPRDLELAIFRVVQECLTNVHRHSGSKTADIAIAREAQTVSVVVQDQGKGLSHEELKEIQTRGSGVGMRGMRERVRLFHGTMNIESNGCGIKVTATIPISESASTSSEPSVAKPLQAAV
jgi:PAS domain S-box-containing protein